MFESDGYHQTQIEAIAEACGVSASTIYRHFETKEQIVLWDPGEDVVEVQLTKRLGRGEPIVESFRHATVAALVERDDTDLLLRRVRLIYAEPTIWAAAAQQDRVDRRELAEGIALVNGRRSPAINDDAMAATLLALLDVALDRWQLSNGRRRLTTLIDEALHSVVFEVDAE
jgi:AcrR family transcriptional regulator